MLSIQDLINLKRIAYKNIKDDSIDGFMEKAFRYYSKTYCTPLSQVRQMNPYEVILIYMEDEMESITAEDMEELNQKINKPKNEVVVQPDQGYAASEAPIDDDAWIAQQTLELKKEQERKKQEEIMKKTHEAIESLNSALSKIKNQSSEENKE